MQTWDSYSQNAYKWEVQTCAQTSVERMPLREVCSCLDASKQSSFVFVCQYAKFVHARYNVVASVHSKACDNGVTIMDPTKQSLFVYGCQ